MSYHCPLCLKLLDRDERLERHCTMHPDRDETFRCDAREPPRRR